MVKISSTTDVPPTAATSIVVVGAGISGLTAAWRLCDRLPKARLTVLEASNRPGGTAWTERIDGYALEVGPNGFLDNKPTTLELCRRLGLADQLVRADPAAAARFVFLGDKLRTLPTNPGAFLRSDLLSWRGRLRVLGERFVAKRLSADDESIYDFGCRRIGREATEVLLDAFVTGILAGDPKLLSLPACFPRMAELERQYGSLIKAQGAIAKQRRAARPSTDAPPVGAPGGTLTAPVGGMRTLTETLARQLGERLVLGAAVRAIHRSATGEFAVTADDGRVWQAGVVILACPAFAQARLLNDIDQGLAAEFRDISYAPAVVAAVGYRNEQLATAPRGFGHLCPQRLGRPVLGMLWSSAIFPNQAPPGCFQFRAILGGWRRRDVLEWDDAAILAAVTDDLRQSLGIAIPPVFSWIYRWPRAIPQYMLGHLDRVARIEKRLEAYPGLFVTGNSLRGVSLNDCTRNAEETAHKVIQHVNGQERVTKLAKL